MTVLTMFFSDISDCELVEASQLVEELECTYLSDVELVSAAGNNLHYSRPLELLQNWLKSVE